MKDSPARIDFHIHSGDYFLAIATMLGFIEEGLNGSEVDVEKLRTRVRELRHDLRYVQANYKISPRPLEDIQIIRPRGNILERRR